MSLFVHSEGKLVFHLITQLLFGLQLTDDINDRGGDILLMYCPTLTAAYYYYGLFVSLFVYLLVHGEKPH